MGGCREGVELLGAGEDYDEGVRLGEVKGCVDGRWRWCTERRGRWHA